MEITNDSAYSSSFSGKAGLLEETRQVLFQLAAGHSLDEVRAMVVEQNILSKQSRYTRQGVWDAIRRRLIGIGKEARIFRLARIVTSSDYTLQAKNLILFYELCRSQQLLADLTTDCLFSLYTSGRSSIDKVDILNWLQQVSDRHPEITTWSPQTQVKIASNYLSMVRDFGLLSGTQQKRFMQVYVPLPTFLYLLYDLHDQGLSTRAILDSSIFHILLIDHEDLIMLLGDATRAGYITFRQSGDICDILFHYSSLDEVIQHVGIGREVSQS